MQNIDLELSNLANNVRSVTQRQLSGRSGVEGVNLKDDGSVVTAVDRGLQLALQGMLVDGWPKYGFLGEEMPAVDRARVFERSDVGIWVVDPLDGSSNFASQFPFFSVSVALIRQGRPVFGVVFDPMRDECFTARSGVGAWLNGRPIVRSPQPEVLADCLAAIDFKRLDAELACRIVREPPYRSQRNMIGCTGVVLVGDRALPALSSREPENLGSCCGFIDFAGGGRSGQFTGGGRVCRNIKLGRPGYSRREHGIVV